MIGLINIVRCCGECVCRPAAGGGVIARLAALLLLGALAYRAAGSALAGIASTAAAANLVMTQAAAAVLVVAAIVAGTWAVLRLYRAPREAARIAEHTARVDRALERQHAPQLDPARIRVPAQRIDLAAGPTTRRAGAR